VRHIQDGLFGSNRKDLPKGFQKIFSTLTNVRTINFTHFLCGLDDFYKRDPEAVISTFSTFSQLRELRFNLTSPGKTSQILGALVRSGNMSLVALKDSGFGSGPSSDCNDGAELLEFAATFGPRLQELTLPVSMPWVKDWITPNVMVFLKPFAQLTKLCLPWPKLEQPDPRLPDISQFTDFVKSKMPRIRYLAYYLSSSLRTDTGPDVLTISPPTPAKAKSTATIQDCLLDIAEARSKIDGWMSPLDLRRLFCGTSKLPCGGVNVAFTHHSTRSVSFLEICGIFCSRAGVVEALDLLVADEVPSLDLGRSSDVDLMASFLSSIVSRGDLKLFDDVIEHSFVGPVLRSALESWVFSNSQSYFLGCLTTPQIEPTLAHVLQLLKPRGQPIRLQTPPSEMLDRILRLVLNPTSLSRSLRRESERRIHAFLFALKTWHPDSLRFSLADSLTGFWWKLCVQTSLYIMIKSMDDNNIVAALAALSDDTKITLLQDSSFGGMLPIQHFFTQIASFRKGAASSLQRSQLIKSAARVFQALVAAGTPLDVEPWPSCDQSLPTIFSGIVFLVGCSIRLPSVELYLALVDVILPRIEHLPSESDRLAAMNLLSLSIDNSLTGCVKYCERLLPRVHPGLGSNRLMKLFRLLFAHSEVEFLYDAEHPIFRILLAAWESQFVSEDQELYLLSSAFASYSGERDCELLQRILQYSIKERSPNHDSYIFQTFTECLKWNRHGLALSLLRSLKSLAQAYMTSAQSVRESFRTALVSTLFSSTKFEAHSLFLLKKFGTELAELQMSGLLMNEAGKLLVHYAASSESRKILEALLDPSFFDPPLDFSKRDGTGSNALHYMSNCPAAAEFVLAHTELIPLLNERNNVGFTPLSSSLQKIAYIRPRIVPGDVLLLEKSPIALTMDENFFAQANTAQNDSSLVFAIEGHLSRFPHIVAPTLRALYSSGARLFAQALNHNRDLRNITKHDNGLNLLQLACMNGYAASIRSLVHGFVAVGQPGYMPLLFRDMVSPEGFTLVMLTCGALDPTAQTSMSERVETLRELVEVLRLTTDDLGLTDQLGHDALHYARKLASKENSSLLPQWLENFLGISPVVAPLFVFGSAAVAPVSFSAPSTPENPFNSKSPAPSAPFNPFG
jgi:hypothetical protein